MQRSALSATALTCTAAGAHEMFRRRWQQMPWSQPRAARLLENVESFARRQKRPFACTFLACGFEHQKPKRCAFSRSGEPTQSPSVPHTPFQPFSRIKCYGEPQHYHDSTQLAFLTMYECCSDGFRGFVSPISRGLFQTTATAPKK